MAKSLGYALTGLVCLLFQDGPASLCTAPCLKVGYLAREENPDVA